MQVVPGDSARNIRKTLFYLLAVTLVKRAKFLVNLGLPAAACDDCVEIALAGRADAKARTVVQQDFGFEDVLFHAPGKLRRHTARVVAEHAPDRAPVVG